MATIEEISRSIIKEAEQKADEILKSYTEQTKSVLKNMESEHEKKLLEIEREKDKTENTIKKKLSYDKNTIISNAQRRGKFEFFEEIISSAANSIVSTNAQEYSLFLEKLIAQRKPPEGAEILFSKNDIKKLGKEFFHKLSKNNNLKIQECDEPCGFIIKASNYIDKVTPQSIANDKKTELMQLLGRYEASL